MLIIKSRVTFSRGYSCTLIEIVRYMLQVRYTTIDNVPVTIFLPDNLPAEGKLPTMVYFHGGGWTWFSVGKYGQLWAFDTILIYLYMCVIVVSVNISE